MQNFLEILLRQIYFFLLSITNLMLLIAPSSILRVLILKLILQKVSWRCTIHRGVRILSLKPQTLEIGDKTIINPYVLLDNRGVLQIGSHVGISSGTKIFTYQHDHKKVHRPTKARKTIIRDHAFIYSDVIVLPGTEIDAATVISAGSVVTGKTVKGALYSGNPAKLRRNNYQIECLNGYYNYFLAPR